MIDLGNEQDVVALVVHRPGRKLLVASADGRGFVVAGGRGRGPDPRRQAGAEPRAQGERREPACRPRATTCAVVGENRKLLVFPLDEVPEMARGRGVILQSTRTAGFADAQVFALADGLTWRLGDRTRTETDLRDWLGERGQAGRLPPHGFPKVPKFG